MNDDTNTWRCQTDDCGADVDADDLGEHAVQEHEGNATFTLLNHA